MDALKRQVERIVRPLRASPTRKNFIREELLGHLYASYEEALEGGVTPDEAALAAVANFGDLREIREGFQISVPKWEQTLFREVPLLRPLEHYLLRHLDRKIDESRVAWAARLTAGFLGVIALIVFVFNPLVNSLIHREPNYPKVVFLGSVMTALIGVGGFLFILVNDAMYAILRRREWSVRSIANALAYGAVLGLLVLVDGLIFGMAVRPFAQFDERHLRMLLVISAFTPVLTVTAALALAEESRRREEWESIDIDE